MSPSLADAHELRYADPTEPMSDGTIDDPERDVERAVAWLHEQLSSPVSRYIWKRDDQVVAELWRAEDAGPSLTASGNPAYRSDLESATEVIRVR